MFVVILVLSIIHIIVSVVNVVVRGSLKMSQFELYEFLKSHEAEWFSAKRLMVLCGWGLNRSSVVRAMTELKNVKFIKSRISYDMGRYGFFSFHEVCYDEY